MCKIGAHGGALEYDNLIERIMFGGSYMYCIQCRTRTFIWIVFEFDRTWVQFLPPNRYTPNRDAFLVTFIYIYTFKLLRFFR